MDEHNAVWYFGPYVLPFSLQTSASSTFETFCKFDFALGESRLSFKMSAESYVETPINGPSVEDTPSMEVPQLPGVLRGGRASPTTPVGNRKRRKKVIKPASHELIVVSCYTRFDNLAHGPRGTEAKRSLYTFRLDENDGELVLYSVTTDDSVMNPAFSRFDPQRNLLYTCTESVAEPGDIVHSGLS
eukprot:s3953_g1.t1